VLILFPDACICVIAIATGSRARVDGDRQGQGSLLDGVPLHGLPPTTVLQLVQSLPGGESAGGRRERSAAASWYTPRQRDTGRTAAGIGRRGSTRYDGRPIAAAAADAFVERGGGQRRRQRGQRRRRQVP
jgi:hypothetical protein